MNKEAAIVKVKLLIRLSNSPNENEAAAAKNRAEKLIEQFGLLEEEYKEVEEKPVYSDDDLLFETQDDLDWINILALAVGNKYDCLIIREENVASTGDRVFKYFVYGDSSDTMCTKMLFGFVKKEIDATVSMHCRGRGDLYISSFCEGVVNGVKINIETEDFHIEGMTVAKSVDEEPKEALVKPEEPKKNKEDIPIKERKNVSKDRKPLDIMAYFEGEGFGRKIHIGKVMEEYRYLMDEEDYLLEEENEDPLVEDYSWVNSLKKLFK